MATSQGELSLNEVARDHERPFYLYDLEDALTRAKHFLKSGYHVHYAMKANTCASLLREFSRLGLGADVVSLGEMQKALACGFPAEKIIFSGVAKGREELEGAVAQRILQVNVESFEELQLLQKICAERGVTADLALRLNIRLTAPTHEHVQTATPVSKFGLDMDQVPEVLSWLKGKRELRLKGIASHIGSQIVELAVFEEMARKMSTLYGEFRQAGFPLERLDLGGGLGIDYTFTGENDLAIADKYFAALKPAKTTGAQLTVEPGRFLTARMGVLLAKVIYVKKTSAQRFLILNAGMNCLMRPALYGSFHRISPLVMRPGQERYTVVGPICESTDKFATDREMSPAASGDWVAIFDTGAYGATMANTYNENPLPEQWCMLNGHWEVL